MHLHRACYIMVLLTACILPASRRTTACALSFDNADGAKPLTSLLTVLLQPGPLSRLLCYDLYLLMEPVLEAGICGYTVAG